MLALDHVVDGLGLRPHVGTSTRAVAAEVHHHHGLVAEVAQAAVLAVAEGGAGQRLAGVQGERDGEQGEGENAALHDCSRLGGTPR